MPAPPSQLPGRLERPVLPAPCPCILFFIGVEGCSSLPWLEGRWLFFSLTLKCFPSGFPKCSPSSSPLRLLGKHPVLSAQCLLSCLGYGTSMYSFFCLFVSFPQGFKFTGFGCVVILPLSARQKCKKKKKQQKKTQGFLLATLQIVSSFYIPYPSLRQQQQQRVRFCFPKGCWRGSAPWGTHPISAGGHAKPRGACWSSFRAPPPLNFPGFSSAPFG